MTEIQVRFGHVDPAGIVYFPRIYDYLHEAFEDLWRVHLGQRYDHLLLERGIGFPLVHSEVDFRSALHFGERPSVSITCFKLGRTSLGLHYVFKVGERVCVDARMTTVCVELRTLEPRPWPAEFRAKFEELLESA